MNLNYHIHESTIKCPFCNREHADIDHIGRRNLDTSVEFDCVQCGKKFIVESCIVYNSYSNCKLNGESHTYEETHIKGFYTCKHCSEFSAQCLPKRKDL